MQAISKLKVSTLMKGAEPSNCSVVWLWVSVEGKVVYIS